MADFFRDLRIASRFAERNRNEGGPDFLLKCRADEIERHGKTVEFSREVFVQLALSFEQERVIFVLFDGRETDSFWIVIFPKDCGETAITGDEREHADRGFHGF